MTAWVNDLKHAVRQLRKSPSSTTVAVLTLALCVSANLAIFAVTDAILIRSLPYPEADRLVIAYQDYPTAGFEHQGCALATYYDWRDAIDAFASTSASRSDSVVVNDTPGRTSQRVPCERVSPEFFETLGVKPAMGRFFTDEETDPARSSVVVLTDAYWRRQCLADPDVLGRTMQVDGKLMTIVGVLYPEFRYLSSRARLFLPLASSQPERAPQARHNAGNTQIIARLAPGASLATARTQIDAFNARELETYPPNIVTLLENTGFRIRLYPLHADHVRGVRPALLWLQGGALFLFVIGCVNLINLLLIRASGRVKEFSLRRVLGAGPRDIIRAVTLETVLIAVIGGAVGLAIGAAGISLLSALGTSELPLGADVAFNLRVVSAALAGSILVGIVFAVPIAMFHLHKHLAPALRTESRSGTAGLSIQRLRYGFVIAQIALAFVLLTGAGLFSLSLRRVLSVSPGFRPDHVLTARVGLAPGGSSDEQARVAFTKRILNDLRTQPGVRSAAISTAIPFVRQDNSMAIVPEGFVPEPDGSVRAHFHCATSGDFWETMGIPLIKGRLLDDSDSQRDQRVCVVDEVFARHYWPQASALGHRLAKGALFDETAAFTIVGVVGSIKQNTLEETAPGAVYFPYRDDAADNVYVVARTSLAAPAMTSAVRRTVARVNPQVPLDDVRTMQSRIDSSLIQRRSPALLAGVFASIALLLTALGTYGVIAYATAQRQREIGVRMALGARPRQVLAQFLATSGKLLAAGLILGVAGAWMIGRAMQSFLFGTSAVDIWVLATTIGVVLVVVLLACFVPACRAASIDPMEALRHE